MGCHEPEVLVAVARDLFSHRQRIIDDQPEGVVLERCTEAFLREARQLADEFDLPLIIHVQETRLQVVTGLIQQGKTLVRHLYELGFLKPKTSLVHAVWLDPEEIGLLAETGASVQHNPWSNLRIGSGRR